MKVSACHAAQRSGRKKCRPIPGNFCTQHAPAAWRRRLSESVFALVFAMLHRLFFKIRCSVSGVSGYYTIIAFPIQPVYTKTLRIY